MALLATVSCTGAVAEHPILLREVTRAAGIDFRHTDGSSGQRYLVETVSAGLATFDYDGDGWIDIYFVNGAPLKGAATTEPPRNALYRNEGDFRFTDVTNESGTGDTGYGLGVAVGDLDNDGDLDIYVNNFGPNVLYMNQGDGTFVDVSARARVGNGNKVGAGASFVDVDGDGCLDLYVANYVRFTYDTHVSVSLRGVPFYTGPYVFPSEPDDLYRNLGDGTFEDVSRWSGIAAHAGAGMGMICADYDDDGDVDILVCNDQEANFLFENDGTGRFLEVGTFSGFAFNLDGKINGSMGVDCGDYDNDGRLDFFETNYQRQVAILYRNLGDGLLEDVTQRTGAGAGSLAHVTWGSGFVDFDNDGDRDLYVACGHVQDLVDQVDDLTSYHARNILLENQGNGRYVNISDRCGDGLAVKLASRGTAFDDLDNDGDIDVVVLNSRREPTVLRNDSRPSNHWLQVRLVGTQSSRDGVNARVRVVAGDLSQVAEVHSGRAYQSHFGTRLHFGLGQRNRVDRVEVRWLGGGQDVVHDVATRQVLTITQKNHAAKATAVK